MASSTCRVSLLRVAYLFQIPLIGHISNYAYIFILTMGKVSFNGPARACMALIYGNFFQWRSQRLFEITDFTPLFFQIFLNDEAFTCIIYLGGFFNLDGYR